MNAPKDGGPAFPDKWMDKDSMGEWVPREQFSGMSLRDWLAGQALVGILNHEIYGDNYGEAARVAYAFSDAMLAEREKEGGPQ